MMRIVVMSDTHMLVTSVAMVKRLFLGRAVSSSR
jgi:predicted phosphodiesterase